MKKNSPIEILGGFVKNRAHIKADEHFGGAFDRLMDMAGQAVGEAESPVKKQTAAEKFDKVPPWCVVKKGTWGYGFETACATHMLDTRANLWKPGNVVTGERNIHTEADARRIARLTRPLDSWEPAPDCPLPVEGWKVREHAPGRVCVYDANGMYVDKTNPRFPTRRAAYVWAWTEAEHTDGTGATDAPDSRGVLGWTAYDQLCKTVDDTECDIVAIQDRVSKVEGVLSRICPEADSQTDGKGRTLVQIDAALEVSYRWHNAAHSAIQATQDKVDDHAARLDKLERLIAAHVPVPAKVNVRSDAASTVEAMTEAAASDEGWREMLVPVSFTHEDSLMWWMTPDRKAYTGHCLNPSTDWGTFDSTLRDFVVVTDNRKDDPVYLAVRSKIAPPPNLAEWYKPGVKATTESGDDAAHRFAKELEAAREAVPPTYRVGDDLAAWVRNLASAHEQALKYQRELERKLGDANTAAVAAEGRAATAVKRASKAEDELAELRAKLETVLK